MMLRYSFGLGELADQVHTAITKVLDAGYRSIDIMSEGCSQIGSAEMGDRILAAL